MANMKQMVKANNTKELNISNQRLKLRRNIERGI